jgi:hypothetical protein
VRLSLLVLRSQTDLSYHPFTTNDYGRISRTIKGKEIRKFSERKTCSYTLPNKNLAWTLGLNLGLRGKKSAPELLHDHGFWLVN